MLWAEIGKDWTQCSCVLECGMCLALYPVQVYYPKGSLLLLFIPCQTLCLPWATRSLSPCSPVPVMTSQITVLFLSSSTNISPLLQNHLYIQTACFWCNWESSAGAGEGLQEILEVNWCCVRGATQTWHVQNAKFVHLVLSSADPSRTLPFGQLPVRKRVKDLVLIRRGKR